MATNSETAEPRKTTQLRSLLTSTDLEFMLEAHNGISARIVEEAGFRGIWASGLALSAQFGVRDNNEASWTQIVGMAEFMADATHIPILLDGDTGYGNFNNMRRLVHKLEQRDIAGVCIEDKIFPKTNSFIAGERQALEEIGEFCGKIAAGKDSQSDDDFCVVARVEAFIAGWDLREAMLRAEAYRKAGADAILIHSGLSTPDQILEFAEEWANRAPLVIVPTKYYSTPTEVFREAKISVAIWANHLIRSSADAMQETARRLHDEQTLVDVEDQIVSVKEIFRLQGADELADAERRYFSGSKRTTRALILAASRGDEFADLTDDRPKVMLPVNGKPLLRRLVDLCKKQSVDSITVVAGYRADKIDVNGIDLVVNERHDMTGELASLVCVADRFCDDMIIMYGDLIFRTYVLQGLLESERELTVVVDSQFDAAGATGAPDYAYCSAPDDRSFWGQDVLLQRLSLAANEAGTNAHGRWIGMLRVRARGREWITEAIASLSKSADFNRMSMQDLLNHVVEQGNQVRVIYVHGHWLDINSFADLERAAAFTARQR
ncbi:MAG: phosphoenolpyruvate mutase [Pseudomonadota bacterium]|nr:phosphoenolpyruvate mutase [Pseudomonadota bacterium]